MQVVNKNGDIFGNGLQVTGPDGKPKTISGGGSPTGPAGGDLFGSYPDPGVVWINGLPTYDLQYYPLSLNPAGYLTSITSSDVITALGYTPYDSTNPSGFITSAALTPYLTSATAASTYYPLTNPSGYLTSAALSGYLTAATAASTYYPNTNPLNFINIVSSSDVTSALGYVPYDSSNPANYIDLSALTPYLTSATAALTYYPLTNPSGYINGISSGDVISALGYIPYDSTNPSKYISGINASDVTTALGFVPYDSSNPAGYLNTITGPLVIGALGYIPYDSSNPAEYVDSTALRPYLTEEVAAATYQPILISGDNIKTINGEDILGPGNIDITGGGSNPRLLGFSGVKGTSTTSTTVTICHSLLIPANTLGTNNILQVVFRMMRESGNLGQMYGRIYFNTSNTLTGATLFSTIFTMNGGSTQYLGYVERNFGYDGINLTTYSNTAYSEYTTGNILNVPLNATVDNYILLTMQAQNTADKANINLYKVFVYA